MKGYAASVATAMALVAGVPVANAAVDGRLKVTPTRARVGQPIGLQLTLYWGVIGKGGYIAKGFPRDYPFKVVALAPNRSDCWRPLRIRLHPTQREWRWRGTIRLSQPGRWIIRVMNFQENPQKTCVTVPGNTGVAVNVES